MATGIISLVNTVGGGGNRGTAATSETSTTNMNVSGGNLVVIALGFAGYSDNSTAPTDTAGNTYVECCFTETDGVASTIWYAANTIANSSDAITVHFSSATPYIAFVAAQYSGASTIESAGDAGDRGLHVVYVGNVGQFFAGSFGQFERCCNEQLGFGSLRSGTKLYQRGDLSGIGADIGFGRPDQRAGRIADCIGRRGEWRHRDSRHQRGLIPIRPRCHRPSSAKQSACDSGECSGSTELERISRSDQL